MPATSRRCSLNCWSRPSPPQLPPLIRHLNAHREAIKLVTRLLNRSEPPPIPVSDSEDRHKPLYALAQRHAKAAVVLFGLGETTTVWPLLAAFPDPTLRANLIHLFAPAGIDPQPLAAHWDRESDVSVRRSILLALGEYQPSDLDHATRVQLVERIRQAFADDPDSGLHGGWLLGRWGLASEVAEIENRLAARDPVPARAWHVNGQGQTLVVVPAPVDFCMGARWDEWPPGSRETLRRQHIDRPYAIGATESPSVSSRS